MDPNSKCGVHGSLVLASSSSVRYHRIRKREHARWLFVPRQLAVHLFKGAIDASQFVADFDHTMSNHSRIKAEEPSYILLRLHGGVELHHKIMALTVLGLVSRRRSRQIELSPVLHATDDAVRCKDLLSGDSSDSVSLLACAWKGDESGKKYSLTLLRLPGRTWRRQLEYHQRQRARYVPPL